MKQANYKKGKIGENIAVEFLLKKGFEIIVQNWQNRFGEIDLIAIDKNTLVFIEVKLKIGEEFGLPEEMIDARKVFQIQRNAEMFLLSESNLARKYPQYRLDAVCIVLDRDKDIQDIRHYENIGA